MILTEEVKIHIKGKFIERYKKLGYNVDTKGLNTIKVKDLPKSSQVIVLVKCDNCGTEKEINIQSYYTSFKNNKYNCYKCKTETYRKTMIEKYGVENCFQLNDIKEKINNTKIKLYGDKNYNNRIKSSETCLNKYGVENPQQNNDIKEKTENTNLINFGYNRAAKNLNVQKKSMNTKKLKYGDEFYNNNIKYKETMIKKYGFDNPMKITEIMLKAQITGLKRKLFKNSNLYYQGTYELDFLEKYYNKINIEKGKSIKIFFNKYTTYNSDFFIPNLNLIVEIKSSYWYKKYYDKNIIKENECRKLGYNYIIIIDKNYTIFDKIINNL
ncbi:hypothetical protein M0Q97_06915 [Candidatus Dojkabacteria bacterium]|jgi:hypothetical protein|nr:hypothetical protein [Candidatus Dojkabacteria bacterium]